MNETPTCILFFPKKPPVESIPLRVPWLDSQLHVQDWYAIMRITSIDEQIAEGRRFFMQTENEISYLKQVTLFAGLSDDALHELTAVAKRRTFRANEVICHRDDPGQVLYMIKEGKVKICLISPDGQEISLVVFGKGECFGELALLDGLPRSADAIAVEKVECYTLQRSDFHNAIMKDPKIAIRVLEVISRRLRNTNEQVEDLIFLDVYGRVAKKLLELSEAHGTKVEDGIRIEVRMTQQELASMVGASRESVNKVMGYFTDKKYISTDKHRITLHRPDDLKRRIY